MSNSVYLAGETDDIGSQVTKLLSVPTAGLDLERHSRTDCLTDGTRTLDKDVMSSSRNQNQSGHRETACETGERCMPTL